MPATSYVMYMYIQMEMHRLKERYLVLVQLDLRWITSSEAKGQAKE